MMTRINKEPISSYEINKRFEVAIESSATQTVKIKVDRDWEVSDNIEYGEANIECTIGIHIFDKETQKTYSFGRDRITTSDDVLIGMFISEILDELGYVKSEYVCKKCGFDGHYDDFLDVMMDYGGEEYEVFECPECYEPHDFQKREV